MARGVDMALVCEADVDFEEITEEREQVADSC